ncbi:unnamed protein product [Urochloa humidicola]
MKPKRFVGGNFRRWQTRVMFWFMSMGLWRVIHPMMPFTDEQTATFGSSSDTALGCIPTLMSGQLYDVYMHCTDPTELWDALERKFAVSEGGRLLYSAEQFYDYSIDDAKSIVAQAHELQVLVGDIASLGCPLPDRFVAAGIIAKLPTSWRNFASFLKHKREDISTKDLIITLDVEEKARAKDVPGTSTQGASANVVVNKPNYKGKGKGNYGGKPKKTTNFKKKPEKNEKIRACYVCGKEGHLAKNCRHCKNRDDDKSSKKVNVTIGEGNEAGGSREHGLPPS